MDADIIDLYGLASKTQLSSQHDEASAGFDANPMACPRIAIARWLFYEE